MIDTVKLYLDKGSAGNVDLLAEIPCYLDNYSEVHNKGEIKLCGMLDNFKLTVKDTGVSLSGSLAKYYLKDNFNTLLRNDIKLAIEKLSDKLHLPVENAKIYRLDIAQNYVVKQKPELYFNDFGDCKNYQRLLNEHSLYYKKKNINLVFYNKVEEGKAKKIEIPEIWKDTNILRYEIRFMKRLGRTLNEDNLKCSRLHQEDFYKKIISMYLAEYKNIYKISKIKLNEDKVKSPKDFKNQLYLYAIQSLGQAEVLKMIEELKLKNVFDKPEYYSRLKKDIKLMCNLPEITENNELIEELDKKINQIGTYCR